jgi:hypothetical protein
MFRASFMVELLFEVPREVIGRRFAVDLLAREEHSLSTLSNAFQKLSFMLSLHVYTYASRGRRKPGKRRRKGIAPRGGRPSQRACGKPRGLRHARRPMAIPAGKLGSSWTAPGR